GYTIERGETAEGVPTFRAVAPPEGALGASRGGERVFEQAAPVESEAFRRWFGDSKVVDENGDPLVVYHGSKAAGFKEFDPSKLGSATGNEGFFGAGFYFTDSESIASGYAGDWDG